MMTKLKISWVLCLLGVSISYAQDFKYQSLLNQVPEKGYYQIEMSAELMGQLNSSKGDIRLYNPQGKEVPYLLEVERAQSMTSLFHEYEIIEQSYNEDEISYLIFHNPALKEIDNISFIVKNTDVRKRARLSGSNDKINWYVIKNDYLLHSMYDSKETSEMKVLNFPLSDYQYFKLEINDNWKLPINILKVGYYDNQSVSGSQVTFDFPIVSQKDSNKISYIHVQAPEKMYFDKLQFKLSGADYYQRYTSVNIQQYRLTKRKKKEYYFQTIGTFSLNSNSSNKISLGENSLTDLYLEIDNKDNQPLHIEQVKGSFLKRYLVAELNPNEKYTLKFGSEKMHQPRYDLVNFRESIPKDLVTINHAPIAQISQSTSENEMQNTSVFDNVYAIWTVIGVVGGVLGIISFKMIKELGEKNE